MKTIISKIHVSSLLRVLGAALIISGMLISSMVQNVSATPEGMVPICHAAGLDGTDQFVTLTLNANAVYGQAGHFLERGTPNAGHEDDYEGPCEVNDPEITICYNGETLTVKQSELGEYVDYIEGECDTEEKLTICINGESIEVEKSDLKNYDNYTLGQCAVPDLVTICYFGESLQIDRSELGNYPGYNLDVCPSPETVQICYRGMAMTVLVADLGNYPGYNLDKCQVKEEDPRDEPEEEVEPLDVPEETETVLLIPVTGGDRSRKVFDSKAGFSMVGFGLVLSGLGFAYKGFRKQM